MATTVDFIECVCSQVAGAGAVRYKKMFGEYMGYVDEKPVLLVCDNTVYIKMLPCLSELMRDAERGTPYNGAKEHYILDIDDAESATAIAKLAAQNTPLPKKKK